MAPRTMASVADELPALAEKHGLSIRAVARALDVNQSHLSRLIAGKVVASGLLAGRLAELFDLPRDYFPEYRQWVLTSAIDTDPSFRDRLYDEVPSPMRQPRI
jgi:transcriptional regulator with XRE-family HTH domain